MPLQVVSAKNDAAMFCEPLHKGGHDMPPFQATQLEIEAPHFRTEVPVMLMKLVYGLPEFLKQSEHFFID